MEVHPGFLADPLLVASNTTNFVQKDPG